eukprot:1184740-Prorocentrum_minimum.AAC.1
MRMELFEKLYLSYVIDAPFFQEHELDEKQIKETPTSPPAANTSPPKRFTSYLTRLQSLVFKEPLGCPRALVTDSLDPSPRGVEAGSVQSGRPHRDVT